MDLLKNLDNMITAEEICNKQFFGFKGELWTGVHKAMIEFAKLHVEKIQKLQKSKYYAGETGYIKEEEFIEILNDIK